MVFAVIYSFFPQKMCVEIRKKGSQVVLCGRNTRILIYEDNTIYVLVVLKVGLTFVPHELTSE